MKPLFSLTSRFAIRLMFAALCAGLWHAAARPAEAQSATVTFLYNLQNSNSGSAPQGALVEGADGNFYGTCEGGGGNSGTAFKVTPLGSFNLLHVFAGYPSDGAGVDAGLTQGIDGNFYGTTVTGGSAALGTIFKVTPTGTSLFHSFNGSTEGALPESGLTLGSDGNFYGTTRTVTSPGTGTGVVFKITLGGLLTVLHTFTGTDPLWPNGNLVQGSHGNFYGCAGGLDGNGNFVNNGALFKVTPAGAFTVLHNFTGTDGSFPRNGLVQGTDGNFYGTTSYGAVGYTGGFTGYGVVFKITPAGSYTILHQFAGYPSDGGNPIASLIQATDGNFYGVAYAGGLTTYSGVLYQITAGGTYTVLYQFSSPGGISPGTNLVEGTDGNLYGTTGDGGSHTNGTIFKAVISPALPRINSITLSPASSTVVTTGTQQFTATARDQNNNVLSPQPSLIWTVSGPGTITQTGLFTADPTAVGPATVTASHGPISGTASITVTSNAPPVPTGLIATPGNTQATLAWNASSGAASYNVKKSPVSGGPYTTIANPTTNSYTNTGLTNGSTYYYVVSAVGGGGESANSTQASAALPIPGSLTGSNTTPPTPIDLTAAGSLDWAHWGLTTATSFDHKSSGGTKISNYTGVGAPSVNQFATNLTGFTWSDGTPTASATNSKTGLYTSGIGKGYSFIVPADTTNRVLKVYVGGWQTGGTLTAHLSDSSAPDYTGTFSNLSVSYNQVFTLTYNAASASKTLTVTWTQTSGTGNVTLQAASLIVGNPNPDFNLSAAPTGVSVVQGNSGTSTITVNPVNGFNSAVTLSASGAPSGVTPTFATNPTTGTSLLTLATTGSAATGTYPITIMGTSGALTHTATVNLTVTAPPVLTTIVVAPASASVVTSGTQQYTATGKDQFGNALSPQPSFTWTVSGGGSISGSGLFTAGGSAGGPFTVTAASGAVSGTASVTVTNPASLTGSNATTVGPVDLTATGTLDWAHWGLTTITSFDHKATGGSQISNYTGVGSPSVNQFSTNLNGFTWTDGTPTASATNSKTGLYTSGIGKGYSFTVPADNTSRILKVYVGGWQTGGTLSAHLSDGSAPDFSGTFSNLSVSYNQVFTIIYNAASAGKTLTVSWTQTSGTGNVTLQAAALASGLPAIPPTPTGLTATAGDTQVTLTWTASTGADSYNVKRSTVTGGPYATIANPTTTSYTNTGLTNGTNYYYVVSAVNAGGESANSTQKSATPKPPVPAVPTGLTASPGDAQVTLTWNASTGATAYLIKRSTASGGPYTGVAGSATTSFTNTGLTNGATYYFVVDGANAGGLSADSNQASATPQLANPPPPFSGDNCVAYQINPAHTGAVTTPNLATPLAKLWTVNLGASVSYPLIADGKVFVTAGDNNLGDDNLYALNASTGAIVWGPVNVGGGHPWATACYDAGSIYTVNSTGVVTAFNDATGAVRWSRSPGVSLFTAAPVALNGTVYITEMGNRLLYALNETDGGTIWSTTVEGGTASPTITNTDLYLDYFGPQAYRFNAQMGGLIWKIDSGVSGCCGDTAAFYQGRLYCRGLYNAPGGENGVALNAATGAAQWNFYPGDVQGSIPALDNGTGIFLQYTGGVLQALNSTTGASLWTTTVSGSPLVTNPIIVNGTVYSGASDGTLYAFNPATGARIWSDNVGAPIVRSYENGGPEPLTGLGAGNSILVVPATTTLVAYAAQPVTPVLTSITVSPSSASIQTSATQQFTATGKDQFGAAMSPQPTITWTVTGGGTINSSGLFTAGASAGGPFTVTATSGSVSGTASVTVTLAPPATPTGLNATPGDTQVSLSWTASSGATGYNVKRATVNGGPYTTVSNPSTASFTNTGLTNGVTYYYVVSAVNGGGESANSTQASATPQPPAPGIPTGLNATPGDAQISLSWTASAGAATYNVKSATVSGGPYTTIASPATTSYTNTGLTNGVTYYYVVSAVNGGGESANSAQASATPQVAAPSAPTGINATPGNTQVSLSWTASSGAITYNVKRATVNGGPYTTIASPAITNYTNTGLTNGTAYYYVVSAVNTGGESANSSQVSATPAIGPTATVTTLSIFDVTNTGYSATTSMLEGLDGKLYGVAEGGGTAGAGTEFSVTTSGSLTVLHNFDLASPEGGQPRGALIQTGDGTLYGTTPFGNGSNFGGIYSSTTSGTISVLHVFHGPDGTEPASGLTQGSDGNFYGTVPYAFAGTYAEGQVYKITPAGVLTVLHTFTGPDSIGPSAKLIQGSDGNFYGSTTGVQSNNSTFVDKGTIFKITPAGVLTTLHAFNGADGTLPVAALVQGADGDYYGTTPYGGQGYTSGFTGNGVAFKITSSGTYTVLHSFGSNSTDGTGPFGALIQATDGNFYGTTAYGGQNSNGTLFEMTPNGVVTTLHAFDNGVGGGFLKAGVIEGTDGNLYGTTSDASTYNGGTVFKAVISPALPAMASIAVSPSSASVTSGATQQFTAVAKDSGGNPLSPQPSILWNVSGGGTILPSGLFTANGSGTFTVTAAHGAISGTASVTVINPAPPVPTGLAATPGDTQVSLSWSTSTGATAYNVQRATVNGGPYTTISSPATASFTNTGLTNGVTYYYVVSAVSSGGESANSAQASATPQVAAPTSPAGLTATPGDTQVSLSWSVVSSATSYNVKSATVSGGPYTTISSPATASFTNTGLTNGVTYYYVVSAVNAGGESGNSTQASATPSASIPNVPQEFSASPGDTDAFIDWKASAGATSYNIKRSTVSGGPYITIASPVAHIYTDTGLTNGVTYYYVGTAVNGSGESANSSVAITTPGPSPLPPTNIVAVGSNQKVTLSWTPSVGATVYWLRRSTVSGGPYYDDAGSTSNGTNSIVDAAVVNGVTYYYAMYAEGANGRSAFSAPVSATPQFQLPPAPSGFTATPGNAAITLNWNAVTGATSYTLNRSTISGGPYTVIANPGGAQPFIDSPVTNGTTYYYVISATNDSGTGPDSAQASATPQTQVPAVPTGLTATPGNAQITLNWTASSGATSYNVKRASVSGGPYTTISSPASTTYANTGLTNGTTYYYVVSAVAAGGESANSAQASATPVAPPSSLSGSSAATAGPIDLTATGGLDWAHWGLTTATSFDHKASGGSQISNYTGVGAPSVNQFATNISGFTWTDGTPTATATNSKTGLYTSGIGKGYSFTVPADTTSRILKVYVGGWQTGGTLTAHLSDGSAPDYTGTATNLSVSYNQVFTVVYNTATAGKTLTVTWTQTSGTGNLTLQAASLALNVDYSLSASPASLSVAQGRSANSTISVNAFGGFNSPVTLSATGAPSGVTPVFATNPTTGASLLTFTATGSAATGTFPITVTGTSGSLTHTVTVNLTVTAPPVLTSIVVSPASTTTATNTTKQFTATAKDQFGGALSPQPSINWTVSGGGSIDSTGLFTAGGAAGGPFTVTATSGSVSGTASITVTNPPLLNGSNAATAGPIDLTATGTGDWAHWGLTTAASFDHKATGGSKISNYTGVGAPSVNQFATNISGFTWTDGTPTAAATNSKTGLYTSGIGKGYSFTVPADTTVRTVKVYVGGWQTGGTLTAHLSDGSVADFTGTFSNLSVSYNQVFTINYTAASAGKTLTITWTQTSGTGNLTLQAATLTP